MNAAVAGAGLVVVPEFEVAEEVRAGQLEAVLCDWRGPELAVFVVLPSRRHVPRRVRTVERFLRQHLASPPWTLA